MGSTLFILLLFIGCLVAASSSGRFIVRFNTYLSVEQLENDIRTSLGADCAVEIVPRSPVSEKFPSDFLVVNMEDPVCLAALRELPSVKSVTVDHVLSRKLLDTNGNYSIPCVGRRTTRFSWADEFLSHGRHLLGTPAENLRARDLWDRGITGKGVKVAIFDTGIHQDHKHFRNIKERTNWTDENSLDDGVGHGSFVAGVIASASDECVGFAPDAELTTFRVFTSAQSSYTSWFMDAFNYAIHKKMNILNLSIGGPDYLDAPFVDKVMELTANNVVIISAIGNDGPLWGTLNNPADMIQVFGVGGFDRNGDGMAPFSSRGMTLHELPVGMGRAKPDVITHSQGIKGSNVQGGCRALSGTSVAAPVVAGAVTLLASSIDESIRWKLLNPASIRQIIVNSAAPLRNPSIFEQGAGALDLLAAYDSITHYEPHASLHPQKLDFTNCPYMWPFCSQPLYKGSPPYVFNTTILNGMSLTGVVSQPPIFVPGSNGEHLKVWFEYSDVIWPYTGYLAVFIEVADSTAPEFNKLCEGEVSLVISSPPHVAGSPMQTSTLWLPIKVKIEAQPDRQKRVLFDVHHNIRYPPKFIPRDRLDVQDDVLDWNGDHPYTNYRGLFNHLRDEGLFVEIANKPVTSYDLSQYGALFFIDTEGDFTQAEINVVQEAVQNGLGLVILADWYDKKVMERLSFFDDNTRSTWHAATGGANIPGLNELLKPYGIAFSERVFNGAISFGSGRDGFFASGNSLAKFPSSGYVLTANIQDQSAAMTGDRVKSANPAILGYTEFEQGRVAVFGDSSCVDDVHLSGPCFLLVSDLIHYAASGKESPIFSNAKPFRS